MSTYVNPVDPPDLGMRPTFGRLLRLWREQWKLGVFALSCSFIYTLISIAIPILIQRAIDNSIDTSQPHTQPLWPYLAASPRSPSLRFVINFNRRYATARIGIRIEARMRELLYQAYLRYPRAFYDRHATGQVLSRATNDLYPIRYFIGWGLVQGMQSVMMIIGAGIVLAFVDPRLTLYAAVSLPPIGYVANRFGHRVSPISRQVQARKGDVTEAADEAVVGIEMVQAFGREDDVRERFGDRAEGVRAAALRQAGVEAQHVPGLYYLPALSIAAVVFFGGRAVIDGQLTIGQFVLFETLLLQLVWPLEAIGWILDLAQRALASAGRSFVWLDGHRAASRAGESTPPPGGPLGVRFENVQLRVRRRGRRAARARSRRRAGRDRCRLRVDGLRQDLAAQPVAALLRPDRGPRARRGRRHPRSADRGAARRRGDRHAAAGALLGAAAREPHRRTRGRRMGRGARSVRGGGRRRFGPSLPEGYDTLIGERGVNLSGGQRQRVALARALVADARVVVLDDPLSAVDTLTERRLVARLRPALAGRTVLVATQRLSTIEIADRAVVLVDGRIVESGTPADLLRAGGEFAALFGDEVVAA